MMLREVTFLGHQDAHHPVGADQLLGKRHLQQARHKDRHADARRDLALEVGEIAALGRDGAAAHLLQMLGRAAHRFEARALVLLDDQPVDVDVAGDLVLDGERIAAGIPHIAGEAGVDIVQQDDAQPHAVGAAVGPGADGSDGGVVNGVDHINLRLCVVT